MAQKTASPKIGLMLPLEGHSDGNIAHWTDLKAMALHAEAIGFDSIWVPDHLIYDFGAIAGIPNVPPWGIWECWSMLAALAAATARVELGPFVACTNFRNPTMTAKMADTVDEISCGRLVLGLGAGYHEPEFRAFGYPSDHLVGRFAEALHIIHTLLREGTIDFHGAYYHAHECELRPRGPRRQGPPILIGARQPRTRRLAAQYADYWNGLGISSAENLAPVRDAVDVACKEVGRDPATLQRTSLLAIDLPGAYERPYGDEVRKFRSRYSPIRLETPDALQDLLRAFACEGVSLVHLWPEPNDLTALDAIALMLELRDRA
jgi:alkanesulfonate monooxygenase SsuD/methylene tetrahydromethanopterin reductase-like flavin-dependent oxidoreductase (luciferase family)